MIRVGSGVLYAVIDENYHYGCSVVMISEELDAAAAAARAINEQQQDARRALIEPYCPSPALYAAWAGSDKDLTGEQLERWWRLLERERAAYQELERRQAGQYIPF